MHSQLRLDFLSVAEDVLKDASPLARSRFGKTQVLQIKERGDLQTRADLAVEEHVVSRLAEAFPQHGILSEETGGRNAEAEYVWVLDPIDGTRYFAAGIPLYSISLALRHGDQFVLGVVYNPETDQLFSGVAGQSASLNGQPIRCSERTDLREATLCVEIPNRHFPPELNREVLGHLATLIDRVERIRMIGVSALGLCYCACGSFDAYLNLSTGSKIWDVAAGRVILQAAGAVVTTTAQRQIVGGPPALHDQLVELLGLQVS